MENLPELDLEAHYIDPMTSNDPEVQKVKTPELPIPSPKLSL